MEAERQKDTSVVISAAPDESQEQQGGELFVGDFIEFETGPKAGTKGMIYYLDEDDMFILPQGTVDRLVSFKPAEIFADESIQIKVEPTALRTFVEIAELKQGNDVQTYTENGEVGAVYKVESVDLENDTATFVEKETGDTLELSFRDSEGRVRGIDRDLPFHVMFSMEGEKPREPEPEVEEEEEEISVEDVLEEPEDEGAEVIEEKRPEQIIYKDDEQKDDFLKMERAALPPEKRSNPKLLKKIRALMENCLALRNEVLEYLDSGVVELKPVTYETLSQLLTQSNFPLAKQVLRVAKSLYFDHTASHYLKKTVDTSDPGDTSINMFYLEDVVKDGNAFLDDQFKRERDDGTDTRQLPKLYTIFQLFYNDYYRVIKPMVGGKKVVADSDRDFFRMNPNSLMERPLLGFRNAGSEDRVLTTADIQTIELSFMRTIKPRIGKYGDRKLKIKGPIEQGDEAEILLYILFPFLFLRDLGTIRSGKLSIDVGNGMGQPKSMETILIEGGGIQTIAKAGDIIAIDPLGETTGNIQLETWLSGQALYGNGLGDLLPYLKSLGMADAEFTPDQQAVLLKKISAYQANLKKFLSETRKIANEIIKNPIPPTNNNLLGSQETVDAFLQNVVRSEEILIRTLADFKRQHPSWQKNDIAAFSYLYTKYPDFVLASASGLPDVAIEQRRVIADRFLRKLYEALEYKKKTEQEGEPPVLNECPHVKNMEAIRKIKDDEQRIQVIVRELLPKFQGKTEDHWIECNVCRQHLMCEHEYLMILEATHPKQKDEIHKNILLKFSDGEFNGKYICGNCGQPIQDLEFDKNKEFDDEGRPMIGDEPITAEMQTSLAKEIDKLLDVSSETFTAKPREAGRDQNERLKLMDEISKKVGVYLSIDSFNRMLRTVDRIVENRAYKDAATYNAALQALKKQATERGEKLGEFPSYEEYYNQFLISACAAMTFIEIQSAIPDFVKRAVAKECGDATFEGYPLINDATQAEGMKYMACAVATLLRAEGAWGKTVWVRISTKDAQTRRTNSILKSLKERIDSLIQEAEIQTLIEKKREYLRNEKGEQALAGRHADKIPPDFLPSPIIPTEETMKAALSPTVAEAASPYQKAFAWLLQGYALARLNGVYEQANPLSEASCCYSPLESPMEFWRAQSLVALGPKQPPRGPHGVRLALKTDVRKAEELLGEPNPRLMYRLFLRVCFRGPRIGLAHEPGYDRKCPYCDFVFPVDPRLPAPQLSYSKDKGLQKKYTEEYNTEVQELYGMEIKALQDAGVVQGDAVQKDTFDSLLQSINNHFIIPPEPPKTVTTDLRTIDELINLNPEPFLGYKTSMETVRNELVKLTPDARDDEIALAYADISNKMREYNELMRSKILRDITNEEKIKAFEREWAILTTAPPQTLGEILRTFFLLPFQRSLTKTAPTAIVDIKRNAVYENIGTSERQTLTAFLNYHWNTTNKILRHLDTLPRDSDKELAKEKIKEFISRLTVVIPLLIKVLRANVIPFGSKGLPFIQGAILRGVLWEFINPENLENNSLVLRDCFMDCILKSQEPDENVIKTPEQIRKIVTDRNESEKVNIIQELDSMTPEEKRAELLMKSLGLGRWARGASRGIFSYDEEQQAFEAEERRRRGIVDFYATGDAEAGDGYDHGAVDGEQ